MHFRAKNYFHYTFFHSKVQDKKIQGYRLKYRVTILMKGLSSIVPAFLSKKLYFSHVTNTGSFANIKIIAYFLPPPFFHPARKKGPNVNLNYQTLASSLHLKKNILNKMPFFKPYPKLVVTNSSFSLVTSRSPWCRDGHNIVNCNFRFDRSLKYLPLKKKFPKKLTNKKFAGQEHQNYSARCNEYNLSNVQKKAKINIFNFLKNHYVANTLK
jgi:hypothetical protein